MRQTTLLESLRLLLGTALVFSGPGATVRAEQPAEKPAENRPSIMMARPLKATSGDDQLRRLLIARYNSEVTEMQATVREFLAGRASYDLIADVAKRLVESSLEVYKKRADQIALLEQFLEITKKAERIQKQRFDQGRITLQDYEHSRNLRLDAEIKLLRAKGKGK